MIRAQQPAPRRTILGFQPPEIDFSEFVPSAQLVLRSAVLASLLVLSFFIAIGAWIVFYNAVGVKPGVVETVWFQYGHFRPPYADLVLSPLLANDQEYDVRLELTVPSSARNVELGNFMVSLLVVDGTGAATLNVSRPATLRYQSPLSNTLSTLSPLSLLSLRSADVQRLSVPLVESAVLRSRRTGQLRAELEMGRKDAHSQVWRRGEVGEVQVYDARLVFEARMKGLSYFLFHHPILLFLLFVPSFLFFELASAALIWGAFVANAPVTPTIADGTESTTSSDRNVKLEETERLDAEALLGRRAGLRPGARMEGEGDDADEEDDRMTGTEEEEGSSNDWEGVKAEESDETDDKTVTGTAGSGTTRATTSTFGPSLPSTLASTSASTS